MKSIRFLLVVFFALTISAFAQTDAQKAFNSIKSMPGTWEGKDQEGRPTTVTFRVTSGGSAVMSEITGHSGEDMISMFHMDGPNKLVLTHYCGAGNQPRMQAATSPDGKVLTFTFFDGTNIDGPDGGHMQRMVLTKLEDDHHTEEWIFADHGKEMKALFDLHRKN